MVVCMLQLTVTTVRVVLSAIIRLQRRAGSLNSPVVGALFRSPAMATVITRILAVTLYQRACQPSVYTWRSEENGAPRDYTFCFFV